MYYRHHSATALVAIVAGVIASTDAQAASRVGGATSVVREVSGSPSGQSWVKKVEGDDVYENEFIRTEAESSTRISFIDETNIRIGPTATMKIDRVVFKTNRSVSELIVTAEEGAIRWNSGVSLSRAYQIKTPDAIIRPSGTTFDLLVESQRTVVVLRRGRIEVCSIDAPQHCQTLSRSGDTIIATPNDLERLQRTGLEPSEFADRCLSANTTAPCVIMASAQPTGSGGVTSPATGRRHANNPPRRTGDSTQTYVTPIVPPHNVEPIPLNVTPIVTPPNVVLIPPYVPRGKRPNPHDPPYVPPVVKRPIPRDVKQIPNNMRPTNVRPTNVRPIYAYARPTMRPTYVRPTVRPTFVRPTSPRPTPIK
jgi:FecR protein